MLGPDGTMHFSELKKFALSAAHYRYAVLVARAEAEGIFAREITPEMRLGTLVDMLLLTDREPVVAGETRTSKAYKAARARTAPNVEVFSETEMARAQVIVHAVRENPVARDYLGLDDPARRTQVPLRWESFGVPRSTRGIDVITRRRLVDLKLTNSTQPDRFMAHARRMGWHAQVTDYREACEQNGIDVSEGCFLLGVESAPPYPVTALRVTDSARTEGEKMIRAWFETYRRSTLAGTWPAYQEEAVDFDILGADFEGLVFPDEATTDA